VTADGRLIGVIEQRLVHTGRQGPAHPGNGPLQHHLG
jgi:hypothetical protein